MAQATISKDNAHSELIARLNAPRCQDRLAALRALRALLDAGSIEHPQTGKDVNNHIHTTYSFSPYSPTKAVWMAYMAGLSTAGIVDHDSFSGVREFIEAGKIMDFPTTIGFEQRVTHAQTAIADRRTNNPDQGGISYLTFHGVPHTRIDAVIEFLKPVGVARGQRNREMCARIAPLLGIALDYEADVLPISQQADGGSVTERHLLYAAGQKLIAAHGRGEKLVAFLKTLLPVSETVAAQLGDPQNPYYDYDLLGLLKGHLVEKFYVPAGPVECPDMREAIRFANENGIIVTYPYLGDVTNSVTGDKKAQVFEDSYLDELFEIVDSLGIRALSYMPSRNTMEQLTRLRALCDRYQMLQISGEDINSPRQSFICKAMRDPVFANLFDTTWALIHHEQVATRDLARGFMCNPLPLGERIAYYKDMANEKDMDQ